MQRQWRVPSYSYNRETTLKGLLTLFLTYNDNDQQGLAETIGTSVEQIARWLNNEFTVGLTTKNKGAFERITGIDLERLYVVEAKRSILDKLSRVKALRRSNLSLARLLERDPALADKIDFDRFVRREEVILELQRKGRECGNPLLALQLGVDARQLPKWAPSYMPSGELLERCIIGVSIDLYVSDPDDTRFKVAADAILGPNFRDWIDAADFTEALTRLFEKWERDESVIVIRNYTGLNESVIRSLRDYKKTGKTTLKTILNVIRVLLERKDKTRLEEFDQRATQFEKDVEQGVITIEPMAREVTVPPEPPRAADPPPGPAKAAAPEPVSTPVPAMPAEQPTGLSSLIEAQALLLAATLLSTRATIDGQLQGLQLHFPDLLRSLSSSGSRSIPPLKRSSDPIEETLELLERLIALSEQTCSLPEAERVAALRRFDPLLVKLKQTFDAAGVAEPADYLRMVRGMRPGRLG